MAGMINQQMQQGADSQQLPAATGADESDPQYQRALKFAMDALYKGNAAAQIAQQVSGSEDAASDIAGIALDIVSIAEERSGGIPEDTMLLVLSAILQEVLDIANAAGMKVSVDDVMPTLYEHIAQGAGASDDEQEQASTEGSV